MTITLVTENGSGDPNANTYNDLAFLTQYHADRGNAYWASVPLESQKACAIRSTDYIDKRFKRRFRGSRQFVGQALGFPRIGFIDDDGYPVTSIVPMALKKAHAEYCLRAAIYNVLAPDPIRTTPSQDMTNVSDPNGDQSSVITGTVRTKTVKAGPVEKSVTYEGLREVAMLQKAGGGSRTEQSNIINDLIIPQYPEADLLIEELLDSGSSTSLVRA